jgi:hypothetical protein
MVKAPQRQSNAKTLSAAVVVVLEQAEAVGAGVAAAVGAKIAAAISALYQGRR